MRRVSAIHISASNNDRTMHFDRVTLQNSEAGHVVHVVTRSDVRDIRPLLKNLPDRAHWSIRASGPGHWFLVCDKTLPRERIEALVEILQPEATAIDQSHGRSRIRLSGVGVEQVLSTMTATDLALAAFPPGFSRGTSFSHIAAHLFRADKNAFEIIVLRSFAQSLWDQLLRAGES